MAGNYYGIELEKEDPTALYDLKERIGRGAFGSVHKAFNKKTKAIAAVKLIPFGAGGLMGAGGEQGGGQGSGGGGGEDGDMQANGLDDIRREVAILRECSHPNIVQFQGVYSAIDSLWIVMEYCGGGSAEHICSVLNEPMTEQQIAYVMREALRGLAYIHAKHRIHRDIKGGNILLTDDGCVKLADFGVSAQLVSTLSKRNSFIGTTYWMAPEVIQEREYDERADIWSIGITAIELAEMQPPHSDLHPVRALFTIPKDPPPTIRAANRKNFSIDFHDFLARCLVKDPHYRPTATELLQHEFLKLDATESQCRQLLLGSIARCRAVEKKWMQEEQIAAERARESAPARRSSVDSLQDIQGPSGGGASADNARSSSVHSGGTIDNGEESDDGTIVNGGGGGGDADSDCTVRQNDSIGSPSSGDNTFRESGAGGGGMPASLLQRLHKDPGALLLEAAVEDGIILQVPTLSLTHISCSALAEAAPVQWSQRYVTKVLRDPHFVGDHVARDIGHASGLSIDADKTSQGTTVEPKRRKGNHTRSASSSSRVSLTVPPPVSLAVNDDDDIYLPAPMESMVRLYQQLKHDKQCTSATSPDAVEAARKEADRYATMLRAFLRL